MKPLGGGYIRKSSRLSLQIVQEWVPVLITRPELMNVRHRNMNSLISPLMLDAIKENNFKSFSRGLHRAKIPADMGNTITQIFFSFFPIRVLKKLCWI